MDDQGSAELQALRRVPFFEDLTPEDLTRIAKIGERRRYDVGSAIVTKDEAGGGLFVILEGSAQVEAGVKVHTLGPGGFFGEMALLAPKPRSATVTAVVAVTILERVADRLREVQERVGATQRSRSGTGGR